MIKKIFFAAIAAACVQAPFRPVQAAKASPAVPAKSFAANRLAAALPDPPSSLPEKEKQAYTGPPGGLYLSTFPYSIVSADFGGGPDIAVSNLTSDTISIFKGLGNGNFVKTADLKTDSGPVSIVAGNFTGQPTGGSAARGRSAGIDLAVACWFGDVVDVFRGDGRGHFAEKPIRIPVGSSPACIRSGYFSGGGAVSPSAVRGRSTGEDFVVSDFNDDSVAIIFNEGNGFFSQPVYLGTGRGPDGLAVGDFNGDGKTDIAVACGRDNLIRMFLGDGNGTFREGGDTKTLAGPAYLAAADFNGDKKLDLAVGYHNSDRISIFPGAGDGTFKKPANIVSRLDPKFIVAGDFNGDGKPDIAAASVFGGKLSILLGNGDFTFSEGPTVIAGTSPRGLAALAMNAKPAAMPGSSQASGAAPSEAAPAAPAHEPAPAGFAVAASSDSSVNVFMGVQTGGFYDLLFKDNYSTGFARPPDEARQRALIQFYLSLGLLPGEEGREVIYQSYVSPEEESARAAWKLWGNRPAVALPWIYDDYWNAVKREWFPDFEY